MSDQTYPNPDKFYVYGKSNTYHSGTCEKSKSWMTKARGRYRQFDSEHDAKTLDRDEDNPRKPCPYCTTELPPSETDGADQTTPPELSKPIGARIPKDSIFYFRDDKWYHTDKSCLLFTSSNAATYGASEEYDAKHRDRCTEYSTNIGIYRKRHDCHGFSIIIDKYDIKVEEAHPCYAPLTTRRDKCNRKTTNKGYCYQHALIIPTGPALEFVGEWIMSGHQEDVPRSGWEAILELKEDGTLRWRETRGANVGAKREGRWRYDNEIFSMCYPAPQVGTVEWKASKTEAGTRTLQGEYSTPDVTPQGKGCGGTWTATKK